MKGGKGVHVSPLQTVLNGRPGAGRGARVKGSMIATPDGPKWTARSGSSRRGKGQQCGRDGIILSYQFLYLPTEESQGDWPPSRLMAPSKNAKSAAGINGRVAGFGLLLELTRGAPSRSQRITVWSRATGGSCVSWPVPLEAQPVPQETTKSH